MADTLNLRQKLVKAMEEIGSVEKTGRNTQGAGYSYQMVKDIYPKVQEAFTKHGIVFTSSQKSVEWPETHESRQGSTLFVCHVTMEFGFWDTDSDEKIVVWHGGEAFDTSDKALNKAKTAALKYCLKQMFLIGEEGEDSETSTDQAKAGTRTQSKVQVVPDQERRPSCPKCGNVVGFLRDKKGNGWFCWKKREGCGANYTDSEYENVRTKPDDKDIDWDGPTLDTSTSQDGPPAAINAHQNDFDLELGATSTSKPKGPQKAAKSLSIEQIDQLYKACESAGVEVPMMLGWFSAKAIEDLTLSQHVLAMKTLIEHRTKASAELLR